MRRSGFTLIELIFVIVILGILAAVALPRFANVSDDASISSEQSNAATVRTAIQAVRGQYLLNGNVAAGTVTVDGVAITVNGRGYPVDLETANPTAFATSDTDSVAQFGSVLSEPMPDWVKVYQIVADLGNGDANLTFYRGPASQNVAPPADINTSAIWRYRSDTGQFTLMDANGTAINW